MEQVGRGGRLTGPNAASDWFTAQLGRLCTLVYMPDATLRPTDRTYAEAITSLSDGFPSLIISQTSLDDLNGRLDAPIGMERFRPNIVIAGGAPFQEDQWSMIGIGDVRFSLVKPCARCVVDHHRPRHGQRNKEPLSTLATYRKHVAENGAVKLDLGMNAVAIGNGSLKRHGRHDLGGALTTHDRSCTHLHRGHWPYCSWPHGTSPSLQNALASGWDFRRSWWAYSSSASALRFPN